MNEIGEAKMLALIGTTSILVFGILQWMMTPKNRNLAHVSFVFGSTLLMAALYLAADGWGGLAFYVAGVGVFVLCYAAFVEFKQLRSRVRRADSSTDE